MPVSTRPTEQKAWLTEKFELFVEHHDKKSLGFFFPPLNEEYFTKWPPTPTPEEIEAADGKVLNALANVRKTEEHRIYRWMFNRLRTKHGVSGNGSLAIPNLTSGPPKLKAAVQTYVKFYWRTKIKQEVINRWAPTPEIDLFDETDLGEDQVSWEALTPMEKSIPLWFRMKIGRELYEAESDKVKAEIDQLREQEKEGALFARAVSNVYDTDEARGEAMKKFDGNFPKLGQSLRNLCSSISREFGFHASIIVGGPLIRDNGRLAAFTYESHGSVHEQLTFSEFLGQSYNTGVSEKFIEYLQHCFPKEERQLYTLKPIMSTVAPPPPVPDAPIVSASKHLPESRAVGPVRTERKTVTARMQTGPMTPTLKARILANMAKKPSNKNNSTANGTHLAVPPTEAGSAETPEPTQSIQSTFTNNPFNDQEVPLDPLSIQYTFINNPLNDQEVPLDPLPLGDDIGDLSFSSAISDFSDNMSFTSTISDVFDVAMDDSGPPATGQWTIIDHFTGEIIIDDEVPAVTPDAPLDSLIPVEVIPALGTTVLVETEPPALLFADQDERPEWLIRSTSKFLQFTPYYMCLGKVINLFLAQEARLGYPVKSTRLPLPARNRPDEIAAFMKNGRDFSRGDNVDPEKFGQKVVAWWRTIQPTTRKAWPPTYGPLPADFSFDYFNHGGPNGVFLMILCLSWWASALNTNTASADFGLVVHDVCWVLEQIAGCA